MSFIVFGLLAFLAGALASANFIIEKLPNSRAYIEKMIPYSDMIGVVALILSVLKLFDVFAGPEDFITKLIYLASVVSTAIVGFLLGFPMVQKFLANDAKSADKAEEIRKKLSPFQILAGLVSLGTGAYDVIYGLFLF
jgi:hypothetical protein